MRNDLIYGIHVIERLLSIKPEQVLEIYIGDHRNQHKILNIINLAEQNGISIQLISKNQLDAWLKGANHQGIAARVRLTASLTWEDLLQQLSTCTPLLLALDGIQDPHNLGAALRTADAAGVNAVIIPKDGSVALTPAVRKVASGAAETVPLIPVTNLARSLEQLKEQGVWIIGASLNAKQSLYQIDFKLPTALVLGAEGAGLRRLTEERCDQLIRIPMLGSVASLNVSVAVGVCLYEAVRQRTL